MGWKRDLGYVDFNKNGEPKKKKLKPAINPLLDFWIFFGGVVLPAAALTIEATTHVCAQNFFDPLPSAAHTVLWAMVPIANFMAWLSIHRDMSQHYGVTLFANGMAVGIAILYTLMFLPLTPIFAIGILFFGLGLLGLSPLLSLLPLWAGANHVGKLSKGDGSRFHPEQAKNLGHIVILVAVLAVELPSTLTRIAISMTNEAHTRQKGIDILRTFGSQDVMLRACYERSGRATDILGSLAEAAHPTNVDVVRGLFYKVTGRTFNSFPIPESARATMQHVGFLNEDYMGAQVDDEFDLDPDMAGEMVSGVSRGLTVSKSLMNAQIDADAGVAQLDWFLNFANKSKYDREVRTRIKLPTGGAVNQASLIVDGKEYECQIMVKSAARAVYQAAVKAKKNPLLVSVCGQDTVLVQCYPVPPGMDVKLHLGVVTPLTIDKADQAVLNLPQFEERNFQVNVAHTLSLLSNHEMKSKWGQANKEKDGFLLTGAIDGGELATGSGVINLTRDAGKASKNWTADPFLTKGYVVSEELQAAPLPSPKQLSILVDGSVSMKDSIGQISEALKKLPKNLSASIIFVSDTGEKVLCDNTPTTDPKFAAALAELARQQCVGGQKDGIGLTMALREVAGRYYSHGEESSDGAVLWVHPSQPISEVLVESNKYILRHWRETKPLLYDMQVASGPNQYIDGINNYSVKKVERFGSPKEDLELLFDQWSTPGLLKKFVYHRDRLSSIASVPQAAQNANIVSASVENIDTPNVVDNPLMSGTVSVPPANESEMQNLEGRRTMKQLAQLWAYDRITSDLRSRKRGRLREALQLAGAYHLVTPISSGILADTVPALDAASKQPSAEPAPSLFGRLNGTDRYGSDAKGARGSGERNILSFGSAKTEVTAVPEAPPRPVEPQNQGVTSVPARSSNASSDRFVSSDAGKSGKSSRFPMMTAAPAGGAGSSAIEGATNGTVVSSADSRSSDAAPAAPSVEGDKGAGFVQKAKTVDAPMQSIKQALAENKVYISRQAKEAGSASDLAKNDAADEEEVGDVDAAMDEIATVESSTDTPTAPQKSNNPLGQLNPFKPAPMVPESDSIWLSLAAAFLVAFGVLKKRFSRKSA